MISKETFLAVQQGVISNVRLQEALQYYTPLEELLRAHTAHSQRYELVWSDVYNKLERLQEFWRERVRKDKELLKRKPSPECELKDPITFDITGKTL